MKTGIEDKECVRAFEQSLLDASKSKIDKNKLGQFPTPPQLATDIVRHTWKYVISEGRLSVLEPACGTGSFISAVLRAKDHRSIRIQGYEIDTEVQRIAYQLWEGENSRVSLADFTTIKPKDDDRVDLLITNPPYSRHHHINVSQKHLLREIAEAITGIRPSGLSGLYCYFILIAHQWLKPDAVSAWLIPTEFMDVNFGKAIKDYLIHNVSLLRIHLFDNTDSLFQDALVSSSVVWFRNQPSSPNGACECTFGNSISEPELTRIIKHSDLAKTKKWTHVFSKQLPMAKGKKSLRLSELFKISRGLVTGSNAYFILNVREIQKHKLPREFLTPILPSSKYIVGNLIRADEHGLPILENRIFLLNCEIPEEIIEERYTSLHKYLKQGEKLGLPKKYLCSRRKPWYSQEFRPPAPIVFTYMGRASKTKMPFRFIRNHSRATATNVYLMLYPTPKFNALLEIERQLLDYVWNALNRITFTQIKKEGRTYGGGLHKIEPRELGNLLIHDEWLFQMFTAEYSEMSKFVDSTSKQLPLFST